MRKIERKKLKLLVCALAVGLIASLANADITTDLVGYWPLGEGTGTTAYDDTGHGWNGEFIGTPEWSNGPESLGGALYFDSRLKDPDSQDGLSCGLCDPSEGKGVFTLALWAYWQGSQEYAHYMTKGGMEVWQWGLWGGSTVSGDKYTDKIGISSQLAGSVVLSSSTMPVNE